MVFFFKKYILLASLFFVSIVGTIILWFDIGLGVYSLPAVDKGFLQIALVLPAHLGLRIIYENSLVSSVKTGGVSSVLSGKNLLEKMNCPVCESENVFPQKTCTECGSILPWV